VSLDPGPRSWQTARMKKALLLALALAAPAGCKDPKSDCEKACAFTGRCEKIEQDCAKECADLTARAKKTACDDAVNASSACFAGLTACGTDGSCRKKQEAALNCMASYCAAHPTECADAAPVTP
jgi:hypothetical protein